MKSKLYITDHDSHDYTPVEVFEFSGGEVSVKFQWRGFIRATHKDIYVQAPVNKTPIRRHSQVYLDSSNFSW